MTSDLRWYLNRLVLMSPAEIGFRARQAVRARLERVGVGLPRRIPARDQSTAGIRLVEPALTVGATPYVEEARRLADGVFDIFALDGVFLGNPPQWNRDPATGTTAPLDFGKSLNYRDPSLVGDIKYLWEPNRHLHLVTLAQAYRLTGEDRYWCTVRKHLLAWFDQCPFPYGPNWTSSLELGIRLINWALTWSLLADDSPLLQGEPGATLRERWLDSVYLHSWFIRHHFSRHSSANNHLIGEATGLLVASATWPYWEDSREWQETATEELAREALLQNAPDGVNREQATSYQQFVLDFLILAGLAARRSGRDFPQSYWARVESMIEFIAAIMDGGGHVPMIGDADDGYVARLDPDPQRSPFRSLLATGAVLFRRGDFKRKAGRLDDTTLWLLGPSARETFNDLQPAPGSWRRAFSEGGYYVLGANLDTADEVRLVVDAGPLGYRSIAAHGHADALALTLSIGGREFLVDPGTYAYHTKQRWRDYFRGSRAHNTVVVDSENQSVIGGSFMWLSKASAVCETWESDERRDRFVGTHDGYTRLDDPVLHRRAIELDKTGLEIVIEDTLECSGDHEIEVCYHFAETCEVTLTGPSSVLAESSGARLELMVRGAEGELLLFHGDEELPAGWISRSFDVKVPTTTIIWRARIAGTASFSTLIACEPGSETDED